MTDWPRMETPDDLLAFVSAQAMDEGLWFEAATAPEAYLQQELRALHAAVEEFCEISHKKNGEQSNSN